MKQTISELLLYVFDPANIFIFTGLVQPVCYNWHSFPSTVTFLNFCWQIRERWKDVLVFAQFFLQKVIKFTFGALQTLDNFINLSLAVPTYQMPRLKNRFCPQFIHSIIFCCNGSFCGLWLMVPFADFDLFALVAEVHCFQKTFVSVTLYIFFSSFPISGNFFSCTFFCRTFSLVLFISVQLSCFKSTLDISLHLSGKVCFRQCL
jgi:hypothetical protein